MEEKNKQRETDKTNMKNLRYKSLPIDMKPNNFKYTTGKWYKTNDISICNRGFHCCKRAIDAMRYVNCEVLALVEVKGDCRKQDNKECWSEIKIVKTHKWTKEDSISLVIYAAELAEPIYRKSYPNDDRIIKAIEAAKKVLKNDTQKNRDTAAAAAFAAAHAAFAAAHAAFAAAHAEFEKTLNKIEEWIQERVKF